MSLTSTNHPLLKHVQHTTHKHTLLHNRWGAEFFEQHLIDHSVEANWGNWAYSAGVGTDPREDRYFNLKKQASTYDSAGQYVRHWLGDRKMATLVPSMLGLYAPRMAPKKSFPAGGGGDGGGKQKSTKRRFTSSGAPKTDSIASAPTVFDKK